MIELLAGIVLLGSGIVAGVFFAFSNFVMSALRRLPPAQGHAAMQHINVTVINPGFLGFFLGTALLAVVLAAWIALSGPYLGSGFHLAGAALYAVGVFGVTIVRNVPMNDALAKIEPDSSNAEAAWRDYLRRWTFWNHVRTAAGIVATALLAWGFR